METKKTKVCPHCGKEILAGALKCRFCKTWLISWCPVCGEDVDENTMICPHCNEDIKEYHQSVKENKMVSTLHKTYQTHPLSFIQKMMYVVTFLLPPQVKLDKLEIDGDKITVIKKKGKVFSAPISDLYFKIEESKEYYYIKMMHGDQMTRILRINPMLSEEEWDEIVCHLRKFSHEIGKDGAEKLMNAVSKIQDVLNN